MTVEDVVVNADTLMGFTNAVVKAMGAPPEVAAEVADHLVGANLCGHDSHGVIRLSQYVGLQDDGLLQSDAATEVVKDGGSVAVLDGNRGFGHWSTRRALDWCVERASSVGVAVASVRHATHIGRLGHYVELAAEQNLIGIVCAGLAGPGAGLVAPHNGIGRYLSTNPWAIGIPAHGKTPMIMDFATSQLAEGKVRIAQLGHSGLPPATLIDTDGAPTDDPQALYDGGALLALGGEYGGHKGFGLGLAAALLGSLAIIDDPDPTPAGTILGAPPTKPWLAGVLVIVLDPGSFGSSLDYAAGVADVLSTLRGSVPRSDADRVLYPGEPEALCRQQRSREGIPIPESGWARLEGVSARFGVPLP